MSGTLSVRDREGERKEGCARIVAREWELSL